MEKSVKGKNRKKPADFYVTLDGDYSVRWFCGTGVCKPGNLKEDIKDCERRSGKKCARFAEPFSN